KQSRAQTCYPFTTPGVRMQKRGPRFAQGQRSRARPRMKMRQEGAGERGVHGRDRLGIGEAGAAQGGDGRGLLRGEGVTPLREIGLVAAGAGGVGEALPE